MTSKINLDDLANATEEMQRAAHSALGIMIAAREESNKQSKRQAEEALAALKFQEKESLLRAEDVQRKELQSRTILALHEKIASITDDQIQIMHGFTGESSQSSRENRIIQIVRWVKKYDCSVQWLTTLDSMLAQIEKKVK